MKALNKKSGLPLKCDDCTKRIAEECQRQITIAQQHAQEIDFHLLDVALQRAGIDHDTRTIVFGNLRMIKRELAKPQTIEELEAWYKDQEQDFDERKEYFYEMSRIKEQK